MQELDIRDWLKANSLTNVWLADMLSANPNTIKKKVVGVRTFNDDELSQIRSLIAMYDDFKKKFMDKTNED